MNILPNAKIRCPAHNCKKEIEKDYLINIFQEIIITMTEINEFFLNGKKYYTKQTINLFDLINYFDYDNSLLVLEYNNLICNKKNWKTISIHNQDKIEIVTIVGGG